MHRQAQCPVPTWRCRIEFGVDERLEKEVEVGRLPGFPILLSQSVLLQLSNLVLVLTVNPSACTNKLPNTAESQ